MADQTLKDVLNAIAKVQNELATVRREMATKSDLGRIEEKVDAHRAETAMGFAAIEDELEKHSDLAHQDIDRELAKLKKAVAMPKRPATRSPRPARRR